MSTFTLPGWLLQSLRALRNLTEIRVVIQHPFGRTLPDKSFDNLCYTRNRFQLLREVINTHANVKHVRGQKLRLLNAGAMGFRELPNLLFPKGWSERILNPEKFSEQWEYHSCDLFPLPEDEQGPNIGLKSNYGSHTVCDLSQNLPQEIGQFDFVLCTDVLEHVRNPATVVINLCKLCKRGATLYLATPFSYPYHPDPEDFWRFTPDGLELLLMEGADSAQRKVDITHKGWDISQRRKNLSDKYSVPTDSLGGWREKWDSYLICTIE